MAAPKRHTIGKVEKQMMSTLSSLKAATQAFLSFLPSLHLQTFTEHLWAPGLTWETHRSGQMTNPLNRSL